VTGPTDPQDVAPTRPPWLFAVLAAVVVEALALAAVAVVVLVQALSGPSADLGLGVALAVLALAFGAGLVLCARGLWAGRRWARAPVVTWQLLQVAAVASGIGGDFGGPATGLVILSAIAVIGVLTPSVVRWTVREDAPPVL
jgi:hypothetical protein